MAISWYCNVGGRLHGPLSANQMRQLAATQQISRDTPVRQGENGAWISASQVQGLFPSSPASTSPPARPQAAQTTLPRGLPVGTPAAGASQSPFIAMQSPDDPSAGKVASRARRHSKKSPWLLITLVVVGILLVGGGVAFMMLGQEDANATAAPQKKRKKKKPKPAPAKPEVMDRQALVQSIKEWQGVSRTKNLTFGLKGIVKVQFVDAWLSDTPGGPRVIDNRLASFVKAVPKKGSDDNGRVKPKETKQKKGHPKVKEKARPVGKRASYVCVLLALTNDSKEKDLQYEGWNGFGKEPDSTSAILVDSNNRFCKLLSKKESSAASRQRPQTLAPGATLKDVLVFKAPAGSFKRLRLVLPYTVIGIKKYNAGLKIPLNLLANPPPSSKKQKPGKHPGDKVEAAKAEGEDAPVFILDGEDE